MTTMQEEQTVINPAEADKEKTESFGKFKTAEELLKAYTALEGEFTKRSQRLKELECAQKTTNDWESKVVNLASRFPIAEKFTDELAQEIALDGDAVKKDNCLENALLRVLCRKVKTDEEMACDENVKRKVLSEAENQELIIRQYLDGRRKNSVPATLSKGGSIPAAPAEKPKTLTAAGEMAKKIIENMQ